MVRGLLDGITDPEVMARYGERQRLVERIAEQMGVSLQDARWALEDFETNTCHCGHTLH
jgi:hypothetical protein